MLRDHEYDISPATYQRYRARGCGPTNAELDEAYQAYRLFVLWEANRCVYGRRKMTRAATRAGWQIGRHKVDRLMAVLGIQGVRRRTSPRTTVSNPNNPRFPDQCKRAWNSVDRPNMWWVADFTYVYTDKGYCYVAFITDVYSRRILGFKVSTTKTTPLVTAVVDQAVATRRRLDPSFNPVGIIHHCDAGSQYTSADFRQAIENAQLTGSIGTVGDAYDNGLMESTIGLYKSEEIEFRGRKFTNWFAVEKATAEWVAWYNSTRLHSSIGYLPPEEFEANFYNSLADDTAIAA